MSGWIGVDLDGTLAFYPHDAYPFPAIGPPIGAMVERVKAWLTEGQDVRILTARVHVSDDDPWIASAASFGHDKASWLAEQTALIEAWCLEHLGQKLPITCAKDFGMIQLWDDRCVQMLPNTGQPLQEAIVEAITEQP